MLKYSRRQWRREPCRLTYKARGAGGTHVQLYDPQLMRLLSFLTRKQGWLLPKDVAASFRIDGNPVSSRTIQRWFAFLREHGGFVYYPYPKSNELGLQDVLVRVRGIRNPAILGVLPFAASFNVEVGLGDGRPFVSQAYWVPGDALRDFEEYWETARDLGLLDGVDLLRSKNTHVIYAPFHEVVTPDGFARIADPMDNAHFAALIRRNLREKFEVRLSERYRESPLVIPIVIEHIWRHYSSQHVWQAIRAAGDEHIMKYGRAVLKKAFERPGSALRLVQQQWAALVAHFDEVFLQPRVLFDWPSLRNGTFMSFLIRTDTERMLEAAVRTSERAVFTALNPGVGPEGMCHVRCFVPNDQYLHVLRVVEEFHRGREPPAIAIQDREATMKLFQPTFCKVDWRLFDPATHTWAFHGEEYVEALKNLRIAQDS